MPKYSQKANSGPTAMRSDGYFAVTGTSYASTALSDGSDATYCKVASGAVLPVDMVCTFPSLGTGERVVSVCPWVRSRQPGTKNVRACVAFSGWTPPDWEVPYASEGLAMSLPTVVGTATAYEVAAQNGQPLVPGDNREWKWYQNTFPMVAFYDPHTADANRALWYEAGLNFYALKAATVASPTAPSGTVSTTQYPACSATVSAVVESWQKPSGLPDFMTGLSVEWSVYAGSLTYPSGTAIATWTSRHAIGAYIDGITASTLACSSAPPAPLPNGALTLFARVSRDHPSGVPAWSARAYKQWTQSVPNPATPTLTATANTPGQLVALQVNAPATTGYDSSTGQVEVERLVGGAWRVVRGMDEVPVAIGSTVLVGNDLECEREATNTYRARVSAWHTADAVRRYSAWTQQAVAGPAFSGSGWNLKALEDPSASWLGAPVVGRPEEQGQRSTAVLEPLDRERPIVLSGTPAGLGGSLEVQASGAAEVAALEGLEDYRGLVYLETAFGDGKHVRLTRASWSRSGTREGPRRVASLEYAEVDAGLAESDA